MIIRVGIFIFLSSILLIACTSPQDRAAEANAQYTEEKTKTLKEYKSCIEDAGDDEKDLKACEALLKAVEAVEGGGKTP